MSQTLLYIVPLILGRTFDINRMQVGVDIFPQNQIFNPVEIQNPITETRYKMVDSSEEARDLLDVSGSFSLNVKSGVVKGGASAAYLTDVYNRQNTVEIAVRATYQTVTEILPSSAQPINTWKSMSALGTHFVRSITYGGELIASVRLICNNTRNKQDIKGALEGGGQIDGIDLGLEVEGAFLKDISKSVENMQIKVFSSIPVTKIPHDITELKLMLDRFPEDMKKYNKGRGVPLKVELWPLEYLDSTRQEYIKNKVLEAHLDSFEQKFDDLLNTKAGIHEWMKIMTEILTDEQERKIGELYADVRNILASFYEVIGNLDMSKGSEQLQPALKAYGKGIPGHYYHRYLQLRENMIHDQGEWLRRRGSGAVYTHWGRLNCTGEAETIYSGFAVGPNNNGGGSNFLCIENRTKLDTESTSQAVPALTQTTFNIQGDRKPHLLQCSVCRLPNRGSVRTFVGYSQCPKDWNILFGGLLLSGTDKSANTEFVCLEREQDLSNIPLPDSTKQYPLVPNWVSTGLQNEEQKLFPCVVCSL